VPGALVTIAIEFISSQAIEKTVRRGLMHISETKAAEIESFVRERRKNVTVAGHNRAVVTAVSQLEELYVKEGPSSPEYLKASQLLRDDLTFYTTSYGFTNLYLFAVDGRLLMRLHEDLEIGPNLILGPLKDSELAEVFQRASILLQAVFSDFQIYPGVRDPLGFTANPVFDTKGLVIGFVVLQLNNRGIHRILVSTEGLGETGETVAGLLKGDTVTLVTPTRFDPDAAFRRKARIGDLQMLALQRGAQGERGYGEAMDYRGKKVIAVWSYLPSLRWGLVVKKDMSEAFELVDRQRLAIAGLLGGTLIVVVLVALLVARSLSRPLEVAVDVANRVAGGDLSAEIQLTAKGEVGKLLRAIKTMTQDLRTLIGKIQRSSISLISTATEIAATSRQQEQSMHDYGTSTNEAAAAVKEISATSQELLRTMTEVNQVAGETADLAAQGQESLAGMDKTMHMLADSTISIGSKLSVISERAANINLVVTTITKVADQTNLLSINAAIEAEKAGEYGLGFLVVAREIRRLADQTAVSTLDIERMVKEMQYSVSAGVMEMDKFSEQVRQGVQEVAEISGQLGKIITAVQSLDERFDQVTEGMRVQSTGADQIREAIVHLSEGVNQSLVSLREFNQATYQLREAVGGLKEEVSRFRIDSTSTPA
jgi:methyl-accepting chemotaxis protein WspA